MRFLFSLNDLPYVYATEYTGTSGSEVPYHSFKITVDGRKITAEELTELVKKLDEEAVEQEGLSYRLIVEWAG